MKDQQLKSIIAYELNELPQSDWARLRTKCEREIRFAEDDLKVLRTRLRQINEFETEVAKLEKSK